MIKKSIPNFITLSNLVCGVLAIRSVFLEEPFWALFFVGLAAFLDFFDGLTARLLGVSGELGKQLDSLADNVSFGVVPAFMLMAVAGNLFDLPTDTMGWLVFVACLLVAAMATMRLAIFNISTNQTTGFVGMPTPGNTLFVGALYYLFFADDASLWHQVLSHPVGLMAVALLSAFWQVLPVPLMALKFKTHTFASNIWRYLFLGTSAMVLAIWQISALPFVILLYIVISIIQNTRIRKK